ncbi:unnamed protein product [Hapterophycus canaliculatus]
MKTGSKIYSLQVAAKRGGGANTDAPGGQGGRVQDVHVSQNDGTPIKAHLQQALDTGGSSIQDTAIAPEFAHLHGEHDEEIAVELPGQGTHAPWPGQHEACEGCGAPSVSVGLGSGPRECEHCHRQIAGGERGVRGKGKDSGAASWEAKPGKQGIVAVTSSREVSLGNERAKALTWAGAVMLSTSSLLLILLLVAWRGIDVSLFSVLSPWVAMYLPIPLGLLNGVWSLHCAKCGHIRHHTAGSCASHGGLCGTAWGCSGPSCALNLGLDLGLLITAVLAALPAGASAKGCGYECYVLLCFPCAPGGGEGMAVMMVLTALGLASAAGYKMWTMAPALLSTVTGEEGFLPW